MVKSKCSVVTCEKIASSLGLCSTHYGRLLHFGNPLGREMVCVECGVVFLREGGRSVTCSQSCSDKHKKRAKRKFDDSTPSLKGERICESCKNVFVGRTNQVTCSPECRNQRLVEYEELRKKKRARPKTAIECRWCDKSFVPMTSAKTCSDDCRARYSRALKTARGKGLITKSCEICGNTFKTGGTSNRTNTCSPDCRAKRAEERAGLRRPRNNESRRGEKNRRTNLLSRFGMTEADYDRMFNEQDGKCAICGTSTPGTSGVFAIDHDHKTGAVRGLLCRSCNVGIGNLGDDSERLLRAADYLNRHSIE